ncbi:hypothetical protein SAMN05444680_11829 [Variovorax sp. YR216]|nr:hypothetical protein SAMN05444680_11829 [Variovorax sp. YR216]
MMGRPLYFASEPRVLLENLSPSRGESPKSVGVEAVEKRLLDICQSRGENSLSQLRERAGEVALAWRRQIEALRQSLAVRLEALAECRRTG